MKIGDTIEYESSPGGPVREGRVVSFDGQTIVVALRCFDPHFGWETLHKYIHVGEPGHPPEGETMTNVRKILCHAEFTCTRCGKPYTCMALATWVDGPGVTGDGERVGHDICNDCEKADRDKEREEYNRSRQQRAWVRKHQRKGESPR